MHTSNLGMVHKYKIEDRRRRVASMLAQSILAKSMTETEMAEQLRVGQSTLSRVITAIRL